MTQEFYVTSFAYDDVIMEVNLLFKLNVGRSGGICKNESTKSTFRTQSIAKN